MSVGIVRLLDCLKTEGQLANGPAIEGWSQSDVPTHAFELIDKRGDLSEYALLLCKVLQVQVALAVPNGTGDNHP